MEIAYNLVTHGVNTTIVIRSPVCALYNIMENSGIATMIGVHMHPTVGSGICNTVVSNSNTPATNAVI
jgi:hypothetical protein